MAESLYRPGLEGIIAGETAVSTIAGGLLYRGYAVEELAQHTSFEEVAYLILYGELPARVERYAFSPQGPTAILKNRHGDSSGVRGAAWLWPEE